MMLTTRQDGVTIVNEKFESTVYEIVSPPHIL